MKKARIVIWCGPGGNQKALAGKVAREHEVAGIVLNRKKQKRRSLSTIISLVWDRIRFHQVYDAWKHLLRHYDRQFPVWPDAPLLEVEQINSNEVADFTANLQPDLVVVSGTSLIKEPLLSVKPRIGIINLHTGLSPYVKGGPNCTNWCIANNRWELIGNTIMWLDPGIDSGNIITTETVDIRKASSLREAHLMVMEHAHALYLRAINYLVSTQPPYNSVSQSDIGKGETYYNKMWTADRKAAVLKNWKGRNMNTPLPGPATIAIPGNTYE